jgi:hypothetical protein
MDLAIEGSDAGIVAVLVTVVIRIVDRVFVRVVNVVAPLRAVVSDQNVRLESYAAVY